MTTLTDPGPGLLGDYRGSCAVCMRGTDTGVGFHGEAEWVVAALVAMGIPLAQASLMVSVATGCDAGKVPVHDVKVAVSVCADCARWNGKPLQTGLRPNVPCYQQRGAK